MFQNRMKSENNATKCLTEEEEDADTRPAEVFLSLTKAVERHRADLK